TSTPTDTCSKTHPPTILTPGHNHTTNTTATASTTTQLAAPTPRFRLEWCVRSLAAVDDPEADARE
ncbi:MAG: hypothetical protein ACLPVY_04755, partial [Acidimicrobiia bacterium]